MKDLSLPISRKILFRLIRHYRHLQAKMHDLKYLFWECTLRCNLKCLHCGSDCQQQTQTPDMPLSDFLRVLDEISPVYDPNTVMLALTGGEPLLRKDLETAGEEFIKRGFPWGIVSNGYGLTEERLTNLYNSGLASITISLDGLEDSHNWMRAKSDSFNKALAAISYCAKFSNLTYDVVTCVNQKNFNQLENLKELLIKTGVKNWRLFTIFPKGRAKDNELLEISGKQLYQLLEFIRKTREGSSIEASFGCDGFFGPYEGQIRNGFFFCRAGINIGSVLIDGSISACPSLRGDYIQGNIYQDKFVDVWEQRFAKMRNRKWMKSGKCKNCEVYPYCEGEGLHLRDEKTGDLLQCHYHMLKSGSP